MDNKSNLSYLNVKNMTNSMPSLRSNHKVELYVFPFIFTIGTICNILTFIVMRRKRMRHQSTYFYMAVLAVADELVLICGCLNFWVYVYTSQTLLIVSALLCKLISVALYATFHFSVWMVVTMTIERFIAVTYPLQASSWCTVKRAKLATFIIAIFILFLNFHFLFTHTLVKDGETVGCQPIEPFVAFVVKVWPWIDASVYSVIPFSLLILFNILIVHNLMKATKKIDKINNSNVKSKKNRNIAKTNENKKTHCLFCCQKRSFFINFQNKPSTTTKDKYDTIKDWENSTYKTQHNQANVKNLTLLNKDKKGANQSSSNNNQASSSNSNRRLTIMLLVISITFITTSLPIVTLQNIEEHFNMRDVNTRELVNLIRGVFLALQYLNHSINFFLYAVTGKSFRKEFYSLFDVCCKKNNPSNFQQKMINSNTFSTTCNNINKNLITSRKDLNMEINNATTKNLLLNAYPNNTTEKILITSESRKDEKSQPSLKNDTNDGIKENESGIFSKSRNDISSLRAEVSILEDQIINEHNYETNF